MNSQSKYTILLISSVLVIYAIVGGMLGRVSAQNGSYQSLSILYEVLNYVQTSYVDEPTMKNVINGGVRGLIETVDPHGAYLLPKELAFYKDFNLTKTPGIGAVVIRRFGYPVIVSVMPTGPAGKAGLGTGDLIESIDGMTTREMNIVQVYSLLSSPVGKPVSLSVIRRRRGGDPETIQLNREPMAVPAVDAKVIETNVAYIKPSYLGAGRTLEVKRQLETLLKRNVMGVVLDLRSTAGGDEQEGVQLANLFLDAGPIGSLEGQKFEKQVFSAVAKNAVTKLPVIAIVNQGTAGAAELVAGAILDNKRGQVIGTKTFGSGSFTKIMPLEDGSALLLSVAKYRTPSGTDIQEAGLKPSVEVLQPSEEPFNPDDDAEIVQPSKTPANEEDRQLKRAVEILKDPTKARKAA